MSDPFNTMVASKYERSWPVPVWAWIIISSAVIIAVNAPRIQADVFPPIEQQSISEARWEDTRVCWRRTGYKNYVVPIVNYDATLDYPASVNGQTIWRSRFPEITREDGTPVVTDRVNPVGWSRVVYCVNRTPDMDATRPMRIRLTIDFKGLWGLYNVPITTPPVVIPPNAVLPG